MSVLPAVLFSVLLWFQPIVPLNQEISAWIKSIETPIVRSLAFTINIPKPTFSPVASSSPVSTPVHTSTLVVVPTSTPIPTAAPTSTPTRVSVSTPANATGSLFMTQINNFRKSKGLSPVSIDSYTCSFANIRAKEITTSFNHDGFSSRISNHTLPYPSYRLVVENLVEASKFQKVVNFWINSPSHAQNLLADVSFGCVGKSGNYYTFEGWKP